MNIEPFVGMKPSVQVSSSALLINPGQQVVLNGRGASIFVWNADNGSVVNYTGPQLIVNPVQTTTYITTGSGLDLCNETASTTVFVSGDVVGVEEEPNDAQLSIYPNPGKELTIIIENKRIGPVKITLQSMTGQTHHTGDIQKTNSVLQHSVDVSRLPAGMYLISIDQVGSVIHRKWIKY